MDDHHRAVNWLGYGRISVPIFLCCLFFSWFSARADGEPTSPEESRTIQAKNWDGPFRFVPSLSGSYSTLIRRTRDRFEFWNSTIGGANEDGIARFIGTSPTQFSKPQIAIPNGIIDDVKGPDGKLSGKRRFTRPSVAYDRKDGYFVIAHVSDGYPPRGGRVYPAFLSSKTGEPGSWRYKGMLKGEIYDEFGPGKPPRWADGRGLFYQPAKPAKLNRSSPLENRFLFFSNQYPRRGCLALLYSADGGKWHFHRRDGKIVNLLPMALQGKSMIFPHVIRAGRHGWFCWVSEKWEPSAIWRIHSKDGLKWDLYGDNQPEILKPENDRMKNLSAWYDPEEDIIHGYIACWTNVDSKGRALVYRNYHSTTRPGAGR